MSLFILKNILSTNDVEIVNIPALIDPRIELKMPGISQYFLKQKIFVLVTKYFYKTLQQLEHCFNFISTLQNNLNNKIYKS